MHAAIKYAAPAWVLTMVVVGGIQAAGDEIQSGSSQQPIRQTGQAEIFILTGTVQKVENNIYTISTPDGQELRLRIEKDNLKGKELKEGDSIQAKVLKGSEAFYILTAQRAGQSPSLQAERTSEGRNGRPFTKMIQGEIHKVEGNLFYIEDPSGKEIRLRVDQSSQQTGDFKKGDRIEALVTEEKEYHVIFVEPAQ